MGCADEIGRKLYALMVRAGFSDVDVQVITRPDADGRLLPMIKNMAEYARSSGKINHADVDKILSIIEQTVSDGREKELLMCAAARLLAVLALAAAGSAVAQEKHLIDPTPPARSIPNLCQRCKIRMRHRRRPGNYWRANRRRFPGRRARLAAASQALFRCRQPGLLGKSCGCRATTSGAILNSFASSSGLPRRRKRLAGTVFWSATCRSPAAARCSPSTEAIKSASTSIFGLRRCQATCKVARSASSARPPMWLRRSGSGHAEHFHVQIACPAGSAECKPQPAPRPSDGCGHELDFWFKESTLHPPQRRSRS